MRDFFALDGTPSTDYGVYIASANMMDAPKRDVSEVSVPGRSGTLLYDNGRWSNGTLTISAYIRGDIRECAQAFRSWLLSHSGYVRYEDTLHPDEYRKVYISSGFEIDDSDHKGGSVELTFGCKPYRYLKVGEEPITLTQNGVIHSDWIIPAKPLIRVYGYGAITVGTGSLTIASGAGDYIDIDCEIKDAYTGAVSKNSYLTVAEWPELTAGDNVIGLTSTISRIEITPRWVTL